MNTPWQSILNFWFDELESRQWWVADEAVDREIHSRFSALHRAAAASELSNWRDEPAGRLAEIIILDQFSRNLYRAQLGAFACDALALTLAQEAIRCAADQTFEAPERNFFYMPFMHSESPIIHAVAMTLFDQPGADFNLEFEIRHKEIIDRFGRYPHRNAILGRESTEEELEFLKQPESSF